MEYNISMLLPFFKLRPVSGAAFSLARYKIDISFFKELNRIVVDFHQEHQMKLWHGFQLIAGDGSTVALPASSTMKKHYGIHSQNKGVKKCMAQIFMLYDLNTNLVIASRMSTMRNSERTLLSDCLIDFPDGNNIILLDRGFGHFITCKRFLDMKKDFCIRLKTATDFGRMVLSNPSNDFIAEWKPSKTERKTLKRHQHQKKSITVRVSKVRLKTGEIEVLISSPKLFEIFTLLQMNELYKLRWGIEEGFKKLKPKMKLEQFGSRKPEGIAQEFESHIFMMNMVALLGIAAQDEIEKKCVGRKLKYKYNWQNAFRFVRHKILQLINYKDINKLVKNIVIKISNSIVAIKPDRVFVRIRDTKHKPRLYQAYK
ncbi:IS4 family transposase [Pedobacter jamesrossensis]|uniref:IS4 family transposase n=1 Tax=Pedobacter jamesrossensis TaxID=1908238 RepID=A0ABV8NKQ5_9SPHI